MKLTKSSVKVLAGSLFLFGAGCAHDSTNAVLEAKLEREPSVRSATDLSKNIKTQIETSQTLSAEQRSRLLRLHSETQAKAAALRSESLRLRSLLVKDVTQVAENSDEVDLIKERLRSVESQRLSLIFSAVDEANSILGHHTAEEKERLLRLFELEHSRF